MTDPVIHHPRLVAVTSGKGGVGKSCLTANLAGALAGSGRRVLVLDADLGLANLDILLNLNPSATLHDVIEGTRTLADAVYDGPAGFKILPAGSGLAEYSRVTSGLQERLPDILAALRRDYDYLFLDTGAGISDVVLFTTALADEVIVVATPEPTSLADAYATIKVMAMQQDRSLFGLVINQATKERSGGTLAQQLQQVADRFLREQVGHDVVLHYLGAVPTDHAVERSVCSRRLLMQYAPDAPAARSIRDVAKALEAAPRPLARPNRLPICTGSDHE